MGACPGCSHDNAMAKVRVTWLRRRLVTECGYQGEPVSGMAGSEVCVCRNEWHMAHLPAPVELPERDRVKRPL
jgi:hypothetical protein